MHVIWTYCIHKMLNIIILACVQAKLLEQLPTRFNTCMSTWLYTLSYTIALFLFVLCNPKNLNHAAKTVLCRYFTLWWQIPLCGAVLASYSVEACAGSWSVRRGRCFFCQWLKHWSKCCTALYVSVQLEPAKSCSCFNFDLPYVPRLSCPEVAHFPFSLWFR